MFNTVDWSAAKVGDPTRLKMALKSNLSTSNLQSVGRLLGRSLDQVPKGCAQKERIRQYVNPGGGVEVSTFDVRVFRRSCERYLDCLV